MWQQRMGWVQGWASSVNGQKPIRCPRRIECPALSFAFYRFNRWTFYDSCAYVYYTQSMKDTSGSFLAINRKAMAMRRT